MKFIADNRFLLQGYDTTSYEIGNYYGLSFEMAREFCQVTILIIVRPVLEASRSKLVCGLVKLDSFNLATSPHCDRLPGTV